MNSLFGQISESFFSIFCHQDASILAEIDDKTLMLCPRCCGLHIGFILAFYIFSLTNSKMLFDVKALTLLAASGIVTILSEWMLAQYGVIQSTHLSRLLTGAIAGTSLACLLKYYINRILKNHSHHLFRRITFLLTNSLFVCSLILYLINEWQGITFLLTGIISINMAIFLHTLKIRLLSYRKFRIINT